MTRILDQSNYWYERAREVIPGGIPGIRSPENFVPGAYPTMLAGGAGGYCHDVDGNRYLDLLLGYGPIVLGHAEPAVDEAAAERAAGGFCLNLPGPVMVELAETLVRLVPSAEQALFFKTGSDATSAAVRIARAHSGRSLVLRCGYHGWHDWCLAGDHGVPTSATRGVLPFDYNRLDQLETLLREHSGQVAAIMVTPVGHDFDRQMEPPAAGFLEGTRRLADEHDVVLIFDEVRTGFRLHLGGAQALYGVTPDLTALGKAMSNGYPQTALVGCRSVMSGAGDTFISSTYFPNGMEMAAALATLQSLERDNVPDKINALGDYLAIELKNLAEQLALPVSLSPYPGLPFLHFDPALATEQPERRDRFYAALAERGVFAHPRHHGFLCWRHTKEDVAILLSAVEDAARTL